MLALDYHESTKHDFNRFARSSGYLDWASQPDPFRRFAGAPLTALPREAAAPAVPYHALYGGAPASPVTDIAVADLLRCAFGLSAWKQYRASRWALRCNPSSGNLHPTEAYLVRGGRITHYAPREHALETRAAIDPAAWQAWTGGRAGVLVALTSIHWREAWKYGERAFRYCQHDAGHAIAAVRLAAARLGWRAARLPRWSHASLAALLGVDRDADFTEAEREEPECLLVVTPDDPARWLEADPAPLAAAARAARWSGAANRLSPTHVEWPIIDRVAEATRDPGVASTAAGPTVPAAVLPADDAAAPSRLPARQVILQRRSAVAFDARSTLPRARFLSMLRRLRPPAPPWDAVDWPPRVHLLIFVHRVDGLVPGVYAYLRDLHAHDEWRAAMRPEFLWENVSNDSNDSLFLLLPTDVAWAANRVSCDQDIAGDGFFSLGMIARLESLLRDQGAHLYRQLFWECGMIGQVLYLEAEAAGARATGIGCFYDDPVHALAGLAGREWQSLYHFSMGVPVDDARLTTEPGYAWESGDGATGGSAAELEPA